MKRFVALLLLAALLASCATPRTRRPTLDSGKVDEEAEIQMRMVVEDQMAMNARVQSIGFTVLKANEPLCEKKMANMGLDVRSLSAVPKDWREAYQQVLGLDERPTVVSVVPGGPADKAGVKVGDRILQVNGAATGKGTKTFVDILNDDFDPKQPKKPIHFQMQRHVLPVTANIEPEVVCGYPLYFSVDSTVNAFADSKAIHVNAGIVRFVRSDDELALIIGHELAHNTQKHIQAKTANQAVGVFFGVLLYGLTGVNVTSSLANIGGQAHSQAFELEADYVGMYYTARAGYSVKDPPYFWRRMSLEDPKSINYGTSHPKNSERFEALRATVREIEDKRTAGLELAPEYENVGKATSAGDAAKKEDAPAEGDAQSSQSGSERPESSN